MGVRVAFERFVQFVVEAKSPADLADAISETARGMGYDYYALTHHVDLRNAPPGTIRLHNYPPAWVDYFEHNSLAATDPIHRASQRTAFGFAWNSVPGMIALTRQDREILALAADHGIGDGFTVPSHVPGEFHGSCSFATATGRPLPARSIALTQVVGAFAFEGARRVYGAHCSMPSTALPVLTDRQRDCLIWVGRGKTDWEISRILDVSEETVVRHIKQARDRYGVQKRTSLLVQALFDGIICFADLLIG